VESDFPPLAQAVASRVQSTVLMSADLFPRTLGKVAARAKVDPDEEDHHEAVHHKQDLGIGGLRGANVTNVRQTKQSLKLAAFSSSSQPGGCLLVLLVLLAESILKQRPIGRAQQSIDGCLLLGGRWEIYRSGASKVDADREGDDDKEADDQDGILEVACLLNTQTTPNSVGARLKESGHAGIRVSIFEENARGDYKHGGW
jgi:hypothetical protein